jgi:hypothetical protein
MYLGILIGNCKCILVQSWQSAITKKEEMLFGRVDILVKEYYKDQQSNRRLAYANSKYAMKISGLFLLQCGDLPSPLLSLNSSSVQTVTIQHALLISRQIVQNLRDVWFHQWDKNLGSELRAATQLCGNISWFPSLIKNITIQTTTANTNTSPSYHALHETFLLQSTWSRS